MPAEASASCVGGTLEALVETVIVEASARLGAAEPLVRIDRQRIDDRLRCHRVPRRWFMVLLLGSACSCFAFRRARLAARGLPVGEGSRSA